MQGKHFTGVFTQYGRRLGLSVKIRVRCIQYTVWAGWRFDRSSERMQWELRHQDTLALRHLSTSAQTLAYAAVCVLHLCLCGKAQAYTLDRWLEHIVFILSLLLFLTVRMTVCSSHLHQPVFFLFKYILENSIKWNCIKYCDYLQKIKKWMKLIVY